MRICYREIALLTISFLPIDASQERMGRHYEELSRSWRNEMDAKQAVLESTQAQILKPRQGVS
jgi:hypothetical protein